jgi:glycosyltransferase involved in cell wall biosynthesis
VCPEGSAIAEAARERGLRVRPVPIGGDADAGFVRRLRNILREENADLVHLHSRRGADVLGGLAARLAGVPAVLSRRVDNPEPRWVVALKYRLYAHVITISEGIRRVLLSEGLAPEKVTCVPSAVDTERYSPGGDREWFRREFGLAEDEPVVGMAAQFIPRKGHRVLMDAAPVILARHPRTRFLLFGQGPEESAVREYAAAVGLGDRVVFAGFRDDMPRILPCLDVLAHPATMEGLGVALLQAAACGVPVVASRVGGIPEAVRDDVNGILVAPGDSDALAEAVSRLLADPALARQLAEGGPELVRRCFSIPAMVDGNHRVYLMLTGERL